MSLEKQLPVSNELRQRLPKEINFSGSENKVRTVLKLLGFMWEGEQNYQRNIIKKWGIIDIIFFKCIFCDHNWPIVHVDDSYILSVRVPLEAWSRTSCSNVKRWLINNYIHRWVNWFYIRHFADVEGWLEASWLSWSHEQRKLFQADERKILNLPGNAVIAIYITFYHSMEEDKKAYNKFKKGGWDELVKEEKYVFPEFCPWARAVWASEAC